MILISGRLKKNPQNVKMRNPWLLDPLDNGLGILLLKAHD